MDDQSESVYEDGEVVWVKLCGYWWPGEVVALEKLAPDVLPSFRKPPIAVVKFFQEDTYEYVKNHNSINKYNCSQKSEYIKKGLDTYRTKHGRNMEKFPEDVIRAETATGGDVNILTRDEFQETKKKSYAGLFGTPVKKSPILAKKGKGSRSETICKFSNPIRKVTHEKSDYKVHILVQSSKSTPTVTNQSDETTVPSTSQSRSESVEKIAVEEKVEDKTENAENSDKSHMQISTPTMSKGIYSCHACPFTTTRLNVMILHNKTHSVTFIPYTPSPMRKKVEKATLKQVSKTKIPKERNSRKEKPEKRSKQPIKRSIDESPATVGVKKVKTDVEIKSSLLADWDDCEEDSIDESLSMLKSGSPDVPVLLDSESPARPTPNELPDANIPADADADVPIASASAAAEDEKNEEKDIHTEEKLEIPSDSKYEFCEDEDWPLEADVGRKIPRVKNASKRKEDTKSLSLDENDVAKEVAELLSKTTVPELPSVPDTLKIEENFPELPIVKTPDKKPETLKVDPLLSDKPENQTPKPTIFKTKTFFRSRHSRSQDAIGKYVAEQLNAAERMDLSENDLNGLETVSSPETRESPPVEHIKIARLAPKIQLKKMKAEALQMQEKEKYCSEQIVNIVSSQLPNTVNAISKDNDESKENIQESPCRLMLNEIETDNKVINQSELNSKNSQESSNVSEEVSDNSDKVAKTVTDSPAPVLTFSDTSLQKSYAQAIETLMSESTASAVDALLSVSLEKDRVTKVISDDPPEDLFEDDNKDNETISNGFDQKVVKEHKSEILLTNELENKNKVLENVLTENKYEKHTHESENSDLTQPNISTLEEVSDVTKPNDDTNQHQLCLLEKDKTAISVPTESDLQIAETLINLPATAIQSSLVISDNLDTQTDLEKKRDIQNCQNIADVISETVDIVSENVKLKPVSSEPDEIQKLTKAESDKTLSNENLNLRFETEQEKCENLNAAQSLVQMSESINHSIGIFNSNTKTDKDENTVEKKDTDQAPVEKTHITISNVTKPKDKFESSSPKLLKILEEPCVSKISATKPPLSKQLVITGKEKILNFDVGGTSPKGKGSTPKQKIIIRRTTGGSTLINKLGAVPSTEKIILSRDNKTQDNSSIQTYTIKTSPDLSTDSNKIVIQPKIRKIAKPSPKLQKLKSQTITETRLINEITSEDPIFDINSMPIVLSDDILTPENIEKMPIVMSDGNIITNQPKTQKIKNKSPNEEKLAVNISNKPEVKSVHKQEIKTFRMNPVSEANKATTPNILSKSSKLRGAKPMLVIDKTTGKQKIIMTKSETPTKEISQIQSKIQPASQNINKSEKFIILPTASSPRPTQRTQKIVIDPQTGKAHVVLTKGPDSPKNVSETKSVPAKLLPSVTDSANTGNTVMIITNSQGAQSRIVLTPEHEKILFPNKQQPNLSQLKPITQRVNTNSILPKASVPTVTSTKTHTKIVPKQKSAIITSKGQLIVGGRVATTAQNIAPMPEIRPVPKRIIASEPKKLVQTIQKTSSEPLIFLQQKSGSVMQLTAAQFEHLQRTGQIIQKSAPVQEGKIILQKSITIPANEPVIPNVQKSKIKRQASNSPTPVKKIKHEITIAPASVTLPTPTPMPALTSLSNSVTTTFVPSVSNTVSVTTSAYPELDNFEELLPSTAIVRQSESSVITPEPTPAPPPASLSDGQLIAVPGEHFGGPPGSFYLCIEDNGTLTPIDNRPLVLENNQLVPMTIEPSPILTPQPERRDILEAALANSDVFHADSPRDEAPDFRDLNANVSVHCRVSETSTTLNQPIMTPVEVPSNADSEPAIPSTIEDGLAVIGVTPHMVPTSLELPITVTDPRIAPKTTDPLSNNNYGTTLLTSPNTEMTFVTTEETDLSVGPISMPLLTEEDSVGKSMPLLTDEVITERTVSSVESTIGSPSSIDVRESETEDGSGGQWARRLLTPGSDTSETSAEIPLQPSIQLSINEISRNS